MMRTGKQQTTPHVVLGQNPFDACFAISQLLAQLCADVVDRYSNSTWGRDAPVFAPRSSQEFAGLQRTITNALGVRECISGLGEGTERLVSALTAESSPVTPAWFAVATPLLSTPVAPRLLYHAFQWLAADPPIKDLASVHACFLGDYLDTADVSDDLRRALFDLHRCAMLAAMGGRPSGQPREKFKALRAQHSEWNQAASQAPKVSAINSAAAQRLSDWFNQTVSHTIEWMSESRRDDLHAQPHAGVSMCAAEALRLMPRMDDLLNGMAAKLVDSPVCFDWILAAGAFEDHVSTSRLEEALQEWMFSEDTKPKNLALLREPICRFLGGEIYNAAAMLSKARNGVRLHSRADFFAARDIFSAIPEEFQGEALEAFAADVARSLVEEADGIPSDPNGFQHECFPLLFEFSEIAGFFEERCDWLDELFRAAGRDAGCELVGKILEWTDERIA